MTQALLRYLRLSTADQLTVRWREVKAVAAALVEHKTLRGHAAVAKVISEAHGIEWRPLAKVGAAVRAASKGAR